ncbi:MAG: ABC transporter permease [Planctomycetes bacterium]|nr:ABC transporter permease [Planctomycetota bacterium]
MGLAKDLQFAGRTLRRNPGFTFAAVLTLALGVGTNTAIFSVVDAVLLSPLPVDDPERIVQIVDRYKNGQWAGMLSFPNYLDYRDQIDAFDQLGAMATSALFLESDRGSRSLQGLFFTSSMFDMLGARMQLGRVFTPEEDDDLEATSIIVSDSFWNSRLGSDPDVIGRTIPLTMFHTNHRGGPRGWLPAEFTVVGVLGREFEIPSILRQDDLRTFSPEVLIPFGRSTWGYGNRGMYGLAVLGHLKPGVTLEQAQAQATILIQNTAQIDPKAVAQAVSLIPIQQLARDQYWAGLRLLWAAAAFVLLIATANIANLLLARGAAREGEIAVCQALGATRGQILRRLLAESGLIGLIGGGLGLLVALGGIRALVAYMPGNIQRMDQVELNLTALGFSFLLAIVAALVASLLPAYRASRLNLGMFLKFRGGHSQLSHAKTMRTLVAAEIGTALVLLVGAGLMVMSFRNLSRIDPGFDRSNLLLLKVNTLPYNTKYNNGPAYTALIQQIVDQVEALPGVIAAGVVSSLPLAGGSSNQGDITIPERPVPLPGEGDTAVWTFAGQGYFEALGCRLIEGRFFSAEDIQQNLQAMDNSRYEGMPEEQALRLQQQESFPVIINETMARQYWPGKSALGRIFYYGTQDARTITDPSTWDQRYPIPVGLEIVGIMADVKVNSLQERPAPHYYTVGDRALRQLAVRIEGSPEQMAGVVSAAIAEIDPADVSADVMGTMDERYEESGSETRAQMLLIVVFAIVSVFMASIGMLGVLGYQLARRRWEIGVRMALGAQTIDVTKLVMREGLFPVAFGIAGGLVGATVLTRFLASWLYGITPLNPVVLATMTSMLLLFTIGLCYMTARRVNKFEPSEILRSE